ncbi:LCP family protein [Alkalihalobacillus sp. MEB130]|uniref:LCP family glycopolymer transferase n=1 Tax=Alkalihalobacillus sp. MEB130 TaxID=2976704 RepID=UPI0028E07B86|nr:LCP family protein [Alkalihalobacillus sp. MEB130]MDT8860326.1 LCP family protein [Alkalihalobacillus sp. MEB130]
MKKKILVSLGLVFIVLLLSTTAFGFYLYNSVTETAFEIHEPLEREQSSKRIEQVTVKKEDPLSFLIAGVDARGDNHKGRSDALIIMTINPNDETIKMVSIPRDTRTEIAGRGVQDKVNHAFSYGGVEMTINTIENLLNIPIDHYVSINMKGFVGIIDALGGISVENELEFDYGSSHYFPVGEIYLDGADALAYSRMRKDDPRGDFGRNDRQRQIVEAVIEEAAQISSITRAGDMLNTVGRSVRTDLTLDDMWSIQNNYRNARHSIEQLELKGNGTTINGIYYLQVPSDEITRVSAILRSHLEMEL